MFLTVLEPVIVVLGLAVVSAGSFVLRNQGFRLIECTGLRAKGSAAFWVLGIILVRNALTFFEV